MTTRHHFMVIGEDERPIIKATGNCMATRKITQEGEPIDFMYRDEPEFEGDSGWRFLSGTESQAYADDPANWDISDLTTLSGKDKAIVPYMDHPVGTALGRVKVPDTFR
ncbi:MAG TPA: DUF2185 domain-containing protein [Prolixibacteraceae bacterium]|nr:DUF2185 domain-containing protein [Prolixibacteraceae bacterium]